MVHGTPWPPYSDYVYPGSDLAPRFADLGVDVVLLGHTHQPMVERAGKTLLVNPGSLGTDNRDPDHRGELSYAVLDTVSEEVEVCWFADPRMTASATTSASA
jgi:putative phosphoesterase